MTTTVRISARAHEILRRRSKAEGISLLEALDRITAEWERMHFFRELNESFAALRDDAQVWDEELEERNLWDGTLADDLGKKMDPPKPGRASRHFLKS